MIKKIVYLIAVILFLFFFFLFMRFRIINSNKKIKTIQTAQTIIPEADIKQEKKSDEDETYNENNVNINSFLDLNKDETLVDSISIDLDLDGFDEQLTAVRKLLDPFIYLIVSVNNEESQKWERIKEIQTAITQPKSLTFYTLDLSNSLPAIVYSGLTSDNSQVLSVMATTYTKKRELEFVQIADIHADVQIQLREMERKTDSEDITLASYKIYAYNSDAETPNTLNQIRTEYTWNKRSNKYEKGLELKIAGEKIESELLRKLQAGNMESFLNFLSGLWNKKTEQNKTRTLYFDEKSKDIIFNIDNDIEEVYEINSKVPRRYGIFFIATNKLIPNITRKIDVEIKGVDEIQVRVTENVARIKFGTGSLWSGIYNKNITIYPHTSKSEKKSDAVKNIIMNSTGAWYAPDNKELLFFDNKYSLKFDEKIENGYFAVIDVDGKSVLQLKNSLGQNKFYIVNFTEKNKSQNLLLNRVNLTLNEIIYSGDEIITFTR